MVVHAPPPPMCNRGRCYCFPRRHLILSIDRRVIYHLKVERSLRVHSEIDSVCLSVPRSSNEEQDFVSILNL